MTATSPAQLLHEDRAAVRSLFRQLASASAANRRKLLPELVSEIDIHVRLEQEVLGAAPNASERRHDDVALLAEELTSMSRRDAALLSEKLRLLEDEAERHFLEDEALLWSRERGVADLDALVRRLKQRRGLLEMRAAGAAESQRESNAGSGAPHSAPAYLSRDAVVEASWESFPASDAPGWRGRR